MPRGDPYYGPLLELRARSYEDPATAWAYSRFDGLWASAGFCVLFLALRWAWNYAFNVLFRRRARWGRPRSAWGEFGRRRCSAAPCCTEARGGSARCQGHPAAPRRPAGGHPTGRASPSLPAAKAR